MNYRSLAFLPDDIGGLGPRHEPPKAKPDNRINYLIQVASTDGPTRRVNGWRVRGQSMFAKNFEDGVYTHLPSGRRLTTLADWYDRSPAELDKMATERTGHFKQDVQSGWIE